MNVVVVAREVLPELLVRERENAYPSLSPPASPALTQERPPDGKQENVRLSSILDGF